jgi:RsmE family RNA methyltransferase
MNLLIFNSDSLDQNNHLVVTGYQHQQIKNTLRLKNGDNIKVGALNGNIGNALLLRIEPEQCLIEVQHLETAPPPLLPLGLIIALPRPQMIKRILQNVATLGIQHVYFIQSNRVEKSYWQSPTLSEDEINRQLILGLEQGMATQLPIVEKHPRFIPFMQDALPKISAQAECYIAEPASHRGLRSISSGSNNLLAIGPEGGFIEKEVELFKESGFEPITMGNRILKVETAVTLAASAFL